MSPLSRRQFFVGAGGAAVGAAAAIAGKDLLQANSATESGGYRNAIEPFYGVHQGGVITPPQSATYFGALNVTATKRQSLVDLMRRWTTAAAAMTAGKPVPAIAEVPGYGSGGSKPDSDEAMGLGPARLTVNFGFGPTLFEQNGTDRFGLASRRPGALVELPRFPGDQLISTKVGGDLTIQACADDPQVAFHAVRQLVRIAGGVAQIVWTQAGFNEAPATDGTTRNLMGFKDGIMNPVGAQLDKFVWVDSEGPSWMRGGTYFVARRIRISLEHWDSKSVSTQEQVIGRYKISGAPLGQKNENDPLDLNATDPAGNPLIPLDSHVRLSAPQENGGRTFLRRGYAYNDGVDPFIERWPPWQQALLYDAGLLFCAYQSDPREGFIPVFQKLAENDSLGQFTTHTGSTIAALPPAASGTGDYVGRDLLEG